MQSLDTTDDQLLPLRKLSSLRTLSLTAPAFDSNSQAVETVASLTGLRHLSLCALGTEDRLVLLQLTKLKQLTRLSYDGHLSGVLTRLVFTRKVSLAMMELWMGSMPMSETDLFLPATYLHRSVLACYLSL
jgi:hypothetical protein